MEKNWCQIYTQWGMNSSLHCINLHFSSGWYENEEQKNHQPDDKVCRVCSINGYKVSLPFCSWISVQCRTRYMYIVVWGSHDMVLFLLPEHRSILQHVRSSTTNWNEISIRGVGRGVFLELHNVNNVYK